jgi:hypothetical protein
MRWIAMVVLFLTAATAAVAQFDSATVLGTVTDPSGAVIAHGQVKVLNTATGLERTTVSGDQGQFQFANLPVGPYRLEAGAQGFQTVTASFELTVGAHQRVDVKLNVASVATTVQATAEAAQLETDSSEHSQVVAAKEIAELPLNGREYSQLVALSSGVVPSPSNLSTESYGSREGAFIVNGLRSVYTNYLLDGVDNNFYGTSNQGFSNQVVQLSPDAVAEFSVVTNNTSAEFGRSGGATINVVTQYGTNRFHGRAWEYLRNTDLNAGGFFKPDVGGKPALHRNQFGVTIGGPIKKDKLFFFADYEGYRQTSSFTDQATLPTLAERGLSSTGASLGYYMIDDPEASNPLGYLPVDNPCNYNVGRNPCNSTNYFGAGLGAAGTATQNALGGTQYLNGQIPSSAVIPFAAALLTYLPTPTNSNLTNNYVILHPGSFDKDKGDAKVDWTPREGLRLFARYSQARLNAFDPGTITGPAGGYGDGNVRAPMKQIVGGATWTINPKSFLEARFGFSAMQAGKTPPLAGQNTMTGALSLPGLPTDPQYAGGVTYQYFLASNDFTSLGRLWTSPQYQNPTVWNPKVNYTRLMGTHSLKAGIEYTLLHVAQQDLHPVLGADAYEGEWSGYAYYNSYYAAYSKYLAGSTTAENIRMFDYADFLLGYQAQIGLASPTISQIRDWGWAGYVQDDWKVTPKLTLNLGLRYEFFTPIYEANNQQANYNPTTQSIVVASSSDRYTVNPNTTDFGPRVGASYALNQKTVVRGGFGIGYTHWNRVGSNYLTMSPPFGIVAQRLVYPSSSTYINTQSGFPANMVSTSNFNPLEDVLQYMPRSSPDTQVWNWLFSVQRDLGRNWMLDLAYVGNHGLNEIIVNDINQAANGGTAPLQARVANTNFGTIAGSLPWATSDYDGLQAKVEKRFSQGLYVLNSFTWSKGIDYAAQALDGGGNCSNCGNGIPSVQNIYNWQADRGISAYNYPFVNVTSAVWSVPVGKGQAFLPNAGRWLDTLVGGWQTTDIFNTRSGNPLTFAYSPNTNQQVSPLITVDGRNSYRPNQTGPAVASNKSYQQYFNYGSFASPALTGSNPYGDSPRNAVRGFAYWSLDMGLTKYFTLTERTKFQFRAEAFNILNHTNFGDPNTNVPDTGAALTSSSVGNFGQITSALPARELQVAAKIVF